MTISMINKRELIAGLVGILAGAAATIGGFKTDALKLCEGVGKGVVIGEKIGPMIGPVLDGGSPVTDAGTADAGATIDAGAAPDAGKRSVLDGGERAEADAPLLWIF
jgi:hypothetical protein